MSVAPRRAALTAIGVALLLQAFLVTTGAVGEARLTHWDEGYIVDQLTWSASRDILLLPGRYNYPSATYWTALAALASLAPPAPGGGGLGTLQRTWLATLQSPAFRVRLRLTFLLLTSLTIPLVAAAVLAWGGTSWSAVWAAALAATSWELAYHARWPAPDGLVMAGTAATIACGLYAARTRQRPWWRAAAFAAGATLGCKYSAWPLPFVITVAAMVDQRAAVWRTAVETAALAALAFVITTPAVLLQPFLLIKDALFEMHHYRLGHVGGHSIAAGAAHVRAMLEYLALAPWGGTAIASAAVTVCAVWGAVCVWRQSKIVVLVLVGFPVLFLTYFSLQRVFIVRNLLGLLPGLAILAAIGLEACMTRVPRAVRWALSAGAVAVVVMGGVMLVRAADNRRQADDHYVRALRDDLSRGRFGMPCATSAARQRLHADAALAASCTAASAVIFSEGDLDVGPDYRPLRFKGIYGRADANYEYYPDWPGGPTLFVSDPETSRRLGVSLAP